MFTEERFLDEMFEDENKKKFYSNFEPVWKNNEWNLKSLKTSKTYHPKDFLTGEVTFKYFYDKYLLHLEDVMKFNVTPVFVYAWLKNLLSIEASQYREAKRLAYINDNLKEDMGPKESVKVLKKSEALYQTSYAEFFNHFNDW